MCAKSPRPLPLQECARYISSLLLPSLPNSGRLSVSRPYYAIADKYDLPALCKLVVQRLVETCDLRTDEADFIEASRVVDDCTFDNEMGFPPDEDKEKPADLAQKGEFQGVGFRTRKADS